MERKFAYPKRYMNNPVLLMITFLKHARRRGTEMFGEEKARLHLPHYAVLVMLEEHGPLSQKDVSVQLDVDPSDLVGFVDRLEQEQCVERQRDTSDRRRHSLAITQKGRDFLEAADERSRRLKDELFAPLSAAERRQFEDMLRRLAAAATKQ